MSIVSRPSMQPTSRKHGASREIGALGAATTGVGAALMTLVAASCCVSPVIAPLIVGVLGASGAVWAAGLKPYGWWILGAAALALAGGFWVVYRPRPACDLGDVPKPGRVLPVVAKVALWIGAVSWTASFIVRLLLPQ